jgi:phage terminase large subunit
LVLLAARHQDNPTLFDRAGNLLDTEDARRRMAALENLSGVRRKRLLEGLWASAEGAVYDMFDSTPGGPHVRKRERSEMKRFFLAIDDGYTNPAVILDIGEDSDGRWHCFREFYQRGQAREVVVATAKQWHSEHPTELVAVDEAVPELIAQLGAFVLAKGGKGKIIDGIRKVQDRLKVQGDGLSRYTVDPSCINHINEFESYVWKPEQDVPVKDNDHSLDCVRYLEDVLTEPTGAWTAEAVRQASVGAPLGQRGPGDVGWKPPTRVFTPRRLF